ncbi:uncharacterized protein LOC127723333 isoform X4 [Mytilus californianus]|uniref:uncharacterized protein LOC127723333 isoform X3 n=1 Tax=Mytilus californianus TaxID=6549 RepID=UPI0022476292|nr:uncharacterized protein LOC127723333 isoform X3 [Mytilus californianus]XP_052085864.1 uncharacterized protein LOC127723333 isoform X4 [Mytilus californianus]XP_052085865.1 uncharacterized protein LOC127723333 isoform X4 [Mytilus californianus]
MRKYVNEHLTRLEQKVLDDLETEHSTLKSQMDTILHDVEKRAKQIRRLQDDFLNMTKYATELQIYVGLREIEKITSQEGNYLENLMREGSFNENNLHVAFSPALESFLNDVKSLGEISIEIRPCNIKAEAGRKYQAQQVIPIQKIDNIKPSFLNTLKIPKGRKLRVVGCCILPDGNFILLDRESNCLVMFKNDGIFMKNVITFEDSVENMCFVKENIVAVILYKACQVTLVDINKSKVVRRIDVPKACYRVASDGHVLVVAMDTNEGVIVMTLHDESKQLLEGIYVHDISWSNSFIYGTKFMQNKVYCYNSSGTLLWTLTHEDISEPAGIALDKNGFIYVACRKSQKIVKVSPDGKSCKTILNHDNRIETPNAIAINKETGVMLISNGDKVTISVSIFKI